MKTAVILWSLLQPHVDDPAMWHQVAGFEALDACEREAIYANSVPDGGEEIYVCQPGEWRPRGDTGK